jgi:hypothetical protein
VLVLGIDDRVADLAKNLNVNSARVECASVFQRPSYSASCNVDGSGSIQFFYTLCGMQENTLFCSRTKFLLVKLRSHESGSAS